MIPTKSPSSRAPSSTDRSLPVLLVHGIDDSGAKFRKMRAALQARGFAHVLAMDIIPPDASISMEAMGAQVQEAAGRLMQTAGDRFEIVDG